MDLLSQMATFVRIVDGKSLSAAARGQQLSLPAVSRQLRALESDLGVSLIVRSTRQLHVTDAGRQWYTHCVRVLREIDEARDAVGTTRGVRGTLVVSASLTFGNFLIVPELPRLAARHPQLVVDLRLEDQLVDLVAEGVDVAIRAGSPPPDSTAFVAQPVLGMYRIVVAAPRWLRKHGTPREPAQLAQHACLLQVTPAGALIRWQLARHRDDAPRAEASDPADGAMDEQTIDVHGQLRSNAPLALRDLALAGAGPAYLPDWLVAADVASGRLRQVLPAWRSQLHMAWAVYRAELRGSPRLRAFLDGLTEVSAQVPRLPAAPAARGTRRAPTRGGRAV